MGRELVIKMYDPRQPRDKKGRWAATAGVGAAVGAGLGAAGLAAAAMTPMGRSVLKSAKTMGKFGYGHARLMGASRPKALIQGAQMAGMNLRAGIKAAIKDIKAEIARRKKTGRILRGDIQITPKDAVDQMPSGSYTTAVAAAKDPRNWSPDMRMDAFNRRFMKSSIFGLGLAGAAAAPPIIAWQLDRLDREGERDRKQSAAGGGIKIRSKKDGRKISSGNPRGRDKYGRKPFYSWDNPHEKALQKYSREMDSIRKEAGGGLLAPLRWTPEQRARFDRAADKFEEADRKAFEYSDRKLSDGGMYFSVIFA